jgi:hypothetical protein
VESGGLSTGMCRPKPESSGEPNNSAAQTY